MIPNNCELSSFSSVQFLSIVDDDDGPPKIPMAFIYWLAVIVYAFDYLLHRTEYIDDEIHTENNTMETVKKTLMMEKWKFIFGIKLIGTWNSNRIQNFVDVIAMEWRQWIDEQYKYIDGPMMMSWYRQENTKFQLHPFEFRRHSTFINSNGVNSNSWLIDKIFNFPDYQMIHTYIQRGNLRISLIKKSPESTKISTNRTNTFSFNTKI